MRPRFQTPVAQKRKEQRKGGREEGMEVQNNKPEAL
jgi:hypothetical protein